MPSRRISALLFAASVTLAAQPFDSSLYRAMRWRQIGPFRAGGVTAVVDIAGNAAVKTGQAEYGRPRLQEAVGVE